MRIVALSISSHEQAPKNRVCCFLKLSIHFISEESVFPDYLLIMIEIGALRNSAPSFIKERRQISGIDTSSTTPDPGYCMGKWQRHRKTSHTGEPRSQSFASMWSQDCMPLTRQYGKDKHNLQMKNLKTVSKKSTGWLQMKNLKTVSKKSTGWLTLVSRYQLHPLFWCGPSHTDVNLASKPHGHVLLLLLGLLNSLTNLHLIFLISKLWFGGFLEL